MNIIESFFKSDTVDYIFAAITCILGCITILMGALAGSNAGDDFTIHAVAVAIIAIGFGLIFLPSTKYRIREEIGIFIK